MADEATAASDTNAIVLVILAIVRKGPLIGPRPLLTLRNRAESAEGAPSLMLLDQTRGTVAAARGVTLSGTFSPPSRGRQSPR
jgi:hypothetical protein